uniref:Enoyl-[acyl-carrier-protein] reductase [NADH] n=1 Tax=Candidatus Aschnera chinzeii TaxID=1485666 RepID=A0AAT9G3Q5_9ENTR|nr:MAG: enoyl-ACP reductase FabI [Candidatus Aschnera chinzeii]
MKILKGKRILITGLASKLSIAFGIAKALKNHGAELAFTYQNDKLKSRILKIANDFNSTIIIECDVASDESIKKLFNELKKIWPLFDGFIHSIAYAPHEQLQGNYIDTITRDAFLISHDISSYSFTALIKACKHMLNPLSSITTITYIGSQRVIPNYNIMGLAKASLEANIRYMAHSLGNKHIRVNGISAGPIKTLAASAIKDFRKMLTHYETITPIKRLVTTEEIGNCAAFLASDLSSGITGEIIHVDGGYNILGAINS